MEESSVPEGTKIVEYERRFATVRGSELDFTGCAEACHDWQDEFPDEKICCRAEVRKEGPDGDTYKCTLSFNGKFREGDRGEDYAYLPREGKRPEGRRGRGRRGEMKKGGGGMDMQVPEALRNFLGDGAMSIASTMTAAVTVAAAAQF